MRLRERLLVLKDTGNCFHFFFFIIGPSSQFEKHCSLVPVCNTKLGQMQSPLVFYLSFLYSPFEYKLSDFRNNV